MVKRNRTLLAFWNIFLFMKTFVNSIRSPLVSNRPAMSVYIESPSWTKCGRKVIELDELWPMVKFPSSLRFYF